MFSSDLVQATMIIDNQTVTEADFCHGKEDKTYTIV